MGSLGGDVIRLTLSKVSTLAASMVSAMMLARILTLDEYGTYSQLLLVSQLFITMLVFGLPNSINYFLAREDSAEGKNKFTSIYFSLATIIGISIGAVLAMATPFIESFFHNYRLHQYIYYLALYPWTFIISNSVENFLVVYRKTNYLIGYRVIYGASLLLLIMAIRRFECGLDEYMAAVTAFFCLFAMAVYVIVARISGKIHFCLTRDSVLKIAVFSVPIGMASIVGLLNTELDKLLIGHMMDAGQMAIYANAAKELPLSIVASSVTAVLLPQMVRLLKERQMQEALRLWGAGIELALIVVAFAVACIFVFAGDVITILYSEKYLPGINVFRIYSLNLVMRCTYWGMTLSAMGKTKPILYCSIASCVLNIALNPLFFFAFGIEGPAVATFVSIMCMLLMQLWATTKFLGVPFRECVPWIGAARILVINGIMGTAVYLLRFYIFAEAGRSGIMIFIVMSAIWGLVYLIVMQKRMLYLWKLLRC